MTAWQLSSFCPILLAIMLTGIVERPSSAQEAQPAEQPGRVVLKLVPPPRRKDATDQSRSQPQPAASVRVPMQTPPPANKTATLTAPPKRIFSSKLAPYQRAEDKVPVPQLPEKLNAAAFTATPVQDGEERTAAKLATTPIRTSVELAAPAGPPSPRSSPTRTLPPQPTRVAVARAPLPSLTEVTRTLPLADENFPPSAPLQNTTAATSEQTVAPGTTSQEGMPTMPTLEAAPPDSPALPEPKLTEPYWVVNVLRLSASGQADLQPLEFDQTIWDALEHSPYVKAVLTVPQISQAKISEASGIFDQTPFVDSIFNDSSDPVGSTLTTGGPNRLNEMRLDNAVGVRAKNALGGTAELAQNLQLRNNNSVFLSPKEQADAKMLLRLNQPLMRGAGRTYTTSSLRIAEFNAGVTQHEAMRKVQLHAQAIANAYWNLFAARAIEMQADRGTERLVYLRDELAKRAEIDGLRSQLLRAEAAIARQNSARARARADVATAEASLRALVNSPALVDGPAALMPASRPIDEPFVVDRTTELQSALAFHPDLLAARDRIKAATTRLKVAENELRPTLNLVMEGYLHGLNGDYGVSDSMMDQFSRGRPSYSGGLNYQRPYRNIVSKAILRERRLELRQLLLDLDNTLLTVTAEVDQAIAAVTASYAELESSVQSTVAFDAEVRYLEGRWQNAFVETTQPSLLLDELLNAQNQLIQSENSWARAQAEHMIAFAKLHVATGMLLSSIPILVCE